MASSPLTTRVESVVQLLQALDVGSLAELEMLLMMLLEGPVGGEVRPDGQELAVTYYAGRIATRSGHFFPVSVVEFVRECAWSTDDDLLGRAGGRADGGPRHLDHLSDDDVAARVRDALGRLRIQEMMSAPIMMPPEGPTATYAEPRGTCPRCASPEVTHYLYGLYPLDPEESNPEWARVMGCVIGPFDRRCEDCDHTWVAAASSN